MLSLEDVESIERVYVMPQLKTRSSTSTKTQAVTHFNICADLYAQNGQYITSRLGCYMNYQDLYT